jgi:regulator of sigma E protease
MSVELLAGNLGESLWSAGFFILAILVIVFVHEYGHYIVGRLSGIHAEVFSLGFGTPIWSRVDSRGTRWQVSAVPLGGYVRFLGDANATSAEADAEAIARLAPEERRHTLHGAPLWARAATVLAGPVFNVILTVAVFAAMLMLWGVVRDEDTPVIARDHALPGHTEVFATGDRILGLEGSATPDIASLYATISALPPSNTVTWQIEREGLEMSVQGPYPLPPLVGRVMFKSAAMDAGLLPGDVILAVDGRPVATFAELPPLVEAAAGAPVALTVWRAGETFDLDLTPRRRDLPTADGGFETRWLNGLTSAPAFELAPALPGPIEALGMAAESTLRVARSSVNGIVAIVKGQISTCNISGAITMAEVVGDAAKSGVESFLGTLAVLSLGIGLMNLLPVPVLDGGHLMFHAWEAVSGRPPSRKALARLTAIGLLAVLSLMLYALGNDLMCV